MLCFVWQKILFHETWAVFMVFFSLYSSVKEPEKGYYFVKSWWVSSVSQSLLSESWKYCSLPLLCLCTVPWAGKTLLQPLIVKRFPFKVQNIVDTIRVSTYVYKHMHRISKNLYLYFLFSLYSAKISLSLSIYFKKKDIDICDQWCRVQLKACS